MEFGKVLTYITFATQVKKHFERPINGSAHLKLSTGPTGAQTNLSLAQH